jgi:methylmalonyl-CoA/ethylmalonyl-CoA epimerase
MSIGTNKAVHMSFVVKDIYAVMKNWSVLLGIDMPEIWKIPGPDVAPVITDGKPEFYNNCLISVIQLDNLALEVCQPDDGPSPWRTFLEKHGEGLMHIAFLTPDEVEAERAIAAISGSGDHYHIGYYPNQSYAFYDTWDALKTELNIKVDRDNSMKIKELQRMIAEQHTD